MTYTTGAGTAIVFNFNSHAHVERDTQGRVIWTDFNDFNSHAHVERDTGSMVQYWKKSISTHTLTWSVTGLYW